MSDLQVVNGGQALQTFSPEQVDLVKRTVAKGATDDELQMFMYLSNRYQLDPFAKEIWFIKYGGTPTIMTSRDGYLKIAQNSPDFMGLISFVVSEGDDFSVDAANYSVDHKFGAKRGQIIGAWAKCDRKGRSPQIAFVPFSEYRDNKDIWKKYPSAMIQKVAEVFVLKRQFGISGLVTREEMGAEYDVPATTSAPQQRQRNSQIPPEQQAQYPPGEQPAPGSSEKQQKAIYAIWKNKGFSEDELKSYLQANYGTEKTSLLTKQQASEVIDYLNKNDYEEIRNRLDEING